ncbi:hypothetical protein ACE193_15580 [Bernardetia sp. OM2101]|uniref:hypothetical protein n=1 Tax=Bernardetia sp. OM2101 TaxID=3344876 RepID=UPI0035CEE422
MLINTSIRISISLLHLSVAMFCFSLFFLFFSEVDFSPIELYQKRQFVFFLLLICLSFLSFCASLSWQTTFVRFSKLLSYLVSLCFLIGLIALFSIAKSTSEELLVITVPTIPPAICFFLLAFSKITQIRKNTVIEYNDSLDSDFLEIQEETNLSIFWKPNRIVSICSVVFSIFLFPSLLVVGVPTWSISIPCFFLIIGIILWLFPKVGSWIFSVVSLLVGTGLVGIFIALLITEPLTITTDKIYIIGSITVVILSLFLLCFSFAMLLLSKEAKQEWKSRH